MVLVEQLRDLFAGFVDRGRDDVARHFTSELDNVLAEIGFNDLHAGFFQRMVEVDLLADHRLSFGHRVGIALHAQTGDDLAGLSAVFGPVHMPALVLDLLFELGEIVSQVVQHVVLDRLGVAAHPLPLGYTADNCPAFTDEAVLGERHGFGQILVLKCSTRVFFKLPAGLLHQDDSFSLQSGASSSPASTSAT